MSTNITTVTALAALRDRCITPHRRLGHEATDAVAHAHLVDAALRALEVAVPNLALVLAAAGAHLFIAPGSVAVHVGDLADFVELERVADLAEIDRTLQASMPMDVQASGWLAGGALTTAGVH
ncbi:hypothetical protein [Aquabacterium sp.]|uniref:hypothetical protein n=1 Tax=Aquabacterium sp. TaxID=1872578 RepID=UPI003783651F